MLWVLILTCLCLSSVHGQHSLRYYYTAVSDSTGSGLPAFSHVGMLDDVQITRYDSERPTNQPMKPWMQAALSAEEWESESVKLGERQKLYLANVKIAMKRSNITTGLNVLQYMSGCELRKDNKVQGIRTYAFNFRDLLSFDLETLQWVAASPIAKPTKEKWDRNGPENTYKKTYSEIICVEWLHKYLKLKEKALQNSVEPEVRVRASAMGSGRHLSCLVTGLNSRDVELTWSRSGEAVPETTRSGFLPNHDGTYQITSYHHVSHLRPEHTYTCHVQHSNFPEQKIVWEGEKTSRVPWVITGCVLLVCIIASVVGIMLWKMRDRIQLWKSGSEQSSSTSGGSEESLRANGPEAQILIPGSDTSSTSNPSTSLCQV